MGPTTFSKSIPFNFQLELLPTTFAVEFSNKNHFLSATVSFKVNSLLSSGRRGAHSAAQADNGVINSEPVGH